MRIAIWEVVTGRDQNSEVRVSRGWKLFTLLPRLLLHRLPRGGLVLKRQLEERFRFFQQRRVGELLARSLSIDAQAHQLSSRRRRRHRQDDWRDVVIVHVHWSTLFELSAEESFGSSSSGSRNHGHLEEIDGP